MQCAYRPVSLESLAGLSLRIGRRKAASAILVPATVLSTDLRDSASLSQTSPGIIVLWAYFFLFTER